MKKSQKKLSIAQKTAKKERQNKYMTIFMSGKQVRVKRPLNIDEVILGSTNPTWLHQNEMWEYIDQQ